MPQEPSPWNVPNALTLLRIALVPVFGWLLLATAGPDPALRWWALGVFAVAMLTDRVDGRSPARSGLVTDFGKVADPIADKALTGMALHRALPHRGAVVVGHHRRPGPRGRRSRCCGSW